MPVLTTHLPALDDYLNHLARSAVIADAGRDAALRQFYDIRWAVIPNLAMDLIVPPLAHVVGIFAAGKLFIVAYTLLLVSGPLAIHLALYRRWSLGPLTGVLFVYSAVTKFGLVNYAFGVGLALWAVASWIALRRAAPWWRLLVSLAWVVVLFFCHAGALLLYGVAITGFTIFWALSEPVAPRRWVVDGAVLVLPALAAVALLLLGPDGDAGFTAPLRWGGIQARRDGLRDMLAAYAWRIDLAVAIAMVVGVVVAVERRMLRLPGSGWAVLLVGLAAFALVPNEAMGGWGAAIRLPWAVLFVLIGLLDWDFSKPRRRRVFLAVLMALALVRSAAAEAAWRRFDAVAAAFQPSLQFIVPGSRVLVARDWDHAEPSLSAIQGLPCLAMIERSSLVSTAFSHPQQQILVVKPPYRASTGGYDDDPIPLALVLSPPKEAGPLFFDPTGRIYWADWVHTLRLPVCARPTGCSKPGTGPAGADRSGAAISSCFASGGRDEDSPHGDRCYASDAPPERSGVTRCPPSRSTLVRNTRPSWASSNATVLPGTIPSKSRTGLGTVT